MFKSNEPQIRDIINHLLAVDDPVDRLLVDAIKLVLEELQSIRNEYDEKLLDIQYPDRWD